MSKVAVLKPGSTEKNWLALFETVPLTKGFDQRRRKECVIIASWSRFKGLRGSRLLSAC